MDRSKAPASSSLLFPLILCALGGAAWLAGRPLPPDLRDAPAALSAAEQLGRDAAPGAAAPEPPQAAAAQAGKPAKPKDWTVLYYSSAKDHLRGALIWQLLDMKKTGSTARVNAVVEAAITVVDEKGRISTPSIRMVLGKAAPAAEMDRYRELLVNSANGPVSAEYLRQFGSDIVATEQGADSGDWRRVAAFAKWARSAYPARKYAFIIYGHGTGFFDERKKPPAQNGANKGTLRDDVTGNYVTTPELAKVLAETGRVDVLVMQSCVMQMAEVAYQVREHAEVVVGSSELMLSVGYDLGGMLRELDSNPAISARDLGAYLAESYVLAVRKLGLPGGHASVILTSKFGDFTKKLDAWVDAVSAFNDRSVFQEAMREAVRFDIFGVTMISTRTDIANTISIACDLYDFVDSVNRALEKRGGQAKPARDSGTALMNSISGGLVYKYSGTGRSNSGFDYGRAHGVSIHVPPVKVLGGSIEGMRALAETDYWDLEFARRTRWGDFLNWLYGRKSAPGK